MRSVHAHELEPPATVLDDVQRQRAIRHIWENGTSCVCGTEATEYDLEWLTDELHRDPEPVPFVCGRCDAFGWCDEADTEVER